MIANVIEAFGAFQRHLSRSVTRSRPAVTATEVWWPTKLRDVSLPPPLPYGMPVDDVRSSQMTVVGRQMWRSDVKTVSFDVNLTPTVTPVGHDESSWRPTRVHHRHGVKLTRRGVRFSVAKVRELSTSSITSWAAPSRRANCPTGRRDRTLPLPISTGMTTICVTFAILLHFSKMEK